MVRVRCVNPLQALANIILPDRQSPDGICPRCAATLLWRREITHQWETNWWTNVRRAGHGVLAVIDGTSGKAVVQIGRNVVSEAPAVVPDPDRSEISAIVRTR